MIQDFSRERGVAAIEFALIGLLMTAILVGLLVFWRFFEVRQSLNRAAGDGARGALTLITLSTPPCTGAKASANRSAIETAAAKIIRLNLEQSGLEASQFAMRNPTWKCPAASTPPTRKSGTFSFDVSYTLPPLLGSSSLIEEPNGTELSNRIMVHFQTF